MAESGSETLALALRDAPDPELARMADAAVLPLPDGSRLAFTTDSYVVQPLFFPGGCIGDLAVHGTVNDSVLRSTRAR